MNEINQIFFFLQHKSSVPVRPQFFQLTIANKIVGFKYFHKLVVWADSSALVKYLVERNLLMDPQFVLQNPRISERVCLQILAKFSAIPNTKKQTFSICVCLQLSNIIISCSELEIFKKYFFVFSSNWIFKNN